MDSFLSSLPIDCVMTIAKYVLEPPIGPANRRDERLPERPREVLRILEVGGLLARACQRLLGHWIEEPDGAHSEAQNALILNTRGKRFFTLARIAKLMDGSVQRLDIRTGTFTGHYPYIVRTYLQSLRSFHLTWPSLLPPALEYERKLGDLLDSMPDLDFLELSIPFFADEAEPGLSRNVHRFKSISLSYTSVRRVGFSWAPVWRAASLRQGSKLSKVTLNVPNAFSRYAELGLPTLHYFCHNVEHCVNGETFNRNA